MTVHAHLNVTHFSSLFDFDGVSPIRVLGVFLMHKQFIPCILIRQIGRSLFMLLLDS